MPEKSSANWRVNKTVETTRIERIVTAVRDQLALMVASADMLTPDRRSPGRQHLGLAGLLPRPVLRDASSRRPVAEDSRTDRMAPLECPLPRGCAFEVEAVAAACALWEARRAGVPGAGWRTSPTVPDWRVATDLDWVRTASGRGRRSAAGRRDDVLGWRTS